MNYFDNLYVPDPFSGSILKPPAIWLVDPYTWPNKPYVGDTWTTDKWPFDDAKAVPYVPKAPWTEKPSRTDWSWEETERIIKEATEREKHKEAYNKLSEQIKAAQKAHFGFNAPKSPWTNTPDGGSKFTLELAGISKATVSVEINYDGRPNIVVKSKVPTVNIGGNWFIPSPERLDMEAAKLNMEDGLLEIFFPPKKVEKKSIKLL